MAEQQPRQPRRIHGYETTTVPRAVAPQQVRLDGFWSPPTALPAPPLAGVGAQARGRPRSVPAERVAVAALAVAVAALAVALLACWLGFWALARSFGWL
jgi:hypothetical protein